MYRGSCKNSKVSFRFIKKFIEINNEILLSLGELSKKMTFLADVRGRQNPFVSFCWERKILLEFSEFFLMFLYMKKTYIFAYTSFKARAKSLSGHVRKESKFIFLTAPLR